MIDLFRDWDDNGSGKVDKREFRRAMASLGVRKDQWAEVNTFFDLFDRDRSGEIDYNELQQMLMDAALERVARGACGSAQSIAPLAAEHGEELGSVSDASGRYFSGARAAYDEMLRPGASGPSGASGATLPRARSPGRRVGGLPTQSAGAQRRVESQSAHVRRSEALRKLDEEKERRALFEKMRRETQLRARRELSQMASTHRADLLNAETKGRLQAQSSQLYTKLSELAPPELATRLATELAAVKEELVAAREELVAAEHAHGEELAAERARAARELRAAQQTSDRLHAEIDALRQAPEELALQLAEVTASARDAVDARASERDRATQALEAAQATVAAQRVEVDELRLGLEEAIAARRRAEERAAKREAAAAAAPTGHLYLRSARHAATTAANPAPPPSAHGQSPPLSARGQPPLSARGNKSATSTPPASARGNANSASTPPPSARGPSSPVSSRGNPAPLSARGQPPPPAACSQSPPLSARGQPAPPAVCSQSPPLSARGQPAPPAGCSQSPPLSARGQPAPPPPAARGQSPPPSPRAAVPSPSKGSQPEAIGRYGAPVSPARPPSPGRPKHYYKGVCVNPVRAASGSTAQTGGAAIEIS